MREWPLNSATLTTTTHSKLREVLDGTNTQVANCAIDRWTAKMKRIEGYITREISRREGNSEDARKFYRWSIRRGEEEIILDRGPRMNFDLPPNHAVDDPVLRWSHPTVEGVLTKAQFSSPLLYQIHYIRPVGFGFVHIYSERSPPNRDPTIGAVYGKNLGASESNNRTGQGQTPKRERWWPTYWTVNGELPRGSKLCGRLAPRSWPSPPPRAGRPASLMGGPRWTPVEEDGGRTKCVQGALRREQFLEIGVGAF